MGIRFFHDEPDPVHSPYRQFLQRHSSVFKHDEPLLRTMAHWVQWNRAVERLAADNKLQYLRFTRS